MSPRSASPTTVLRSSLKAHTILAKRLATPAEAVTRAMEQFPEVFTRDDPQWIRRCISSKIRLCSILFTDWTLLVFYAYPHPAAVCQQHAPQHKKRQDPAHPYGDAKEHFFFVPTWPPTATSKSISVQVTQTYQRGIPTILVNGYIYPESATFTSCRIRRWRKTWYSS